MLPEPTSKAKWYPGSSPCCGKGIFDNRLTAKGPQSPVLRCSGCGMVGWINEDQSWSWAKPKRTNKRGS